MLPDWGLASSGDLPPKAEKLQSWTRKLLVHGFLDQLAETWRSLVEVHLKQLEGGGTGRGLEAELKRRTVPP